MQSTTQSIKKSRAIWGRGRGVDWILSDWQRKPIWREVSFHKHIQGHAAMYEAVPDTLEPGVRNALEKRGIHRLYTHQVEAFHAIRAGQNCGCVYADGIGQISLLQSTHSQCVRAG